jgi:hypothetical protein
MLLSFEVLVYESDYKPKKSITIIVP